MLVTGESCQSCGCFETKPCQPGWLVKMLRGISFFVGLLCLIHGGSAENFSVYTNSIKSKFGYSQSNMALIVGIGYFGSTLSAPPGWFVDRFGPRWTSLVTFLVCTTGYMLLWSTVRNIPFYEDKAWLQSIYFFIAYFSSATSYMVAMVTTVRNFDGPMRGTVISILDTAYSLGSAIFIAIYGRFFVNGHFKDSQNQDLGGFYLFSAIAGAIIFGLAIIFLDYYERDIDVIIPAENTNTDDVMKSNGNSCENMSSSAGSSVKHTPFVSLLKNWDFQFLFWVYILASGATIVFKTNLNVYLRSYGQEKQGDFLNVIFPIIATVYKLAAGVLSDKFIRRVPRPFYLFLPLLLMTLPLIICIFLSDRFPVIILTVITVGLGVGALTTFTPTLCSDFFGLQDFGCIWGIYLTASGISSAIVQRIFAALYDVEISDPTDIYCYGIKCFRWSFTVFATLTACSALFVFALIERGR